MHIKDIQPEYLVLVSFTKKEFIPTFNRFGPFKSLTITYRSYLDYVRLGKSVVLEAVFVNNAYEAIDTTRPDVPFSVARLISTKEEKPVVEVIEEVAIVEEIISEEVLEEQVDLSDTIPDNLKIDEDEEEITFLKLSKTDYNKMTEKKLYDHLKEIENGIPEEHLPLEGKTKKQLLKIIDEVILA